MASGVVGDAGMPVVALIHSPLVGPSTWRGVAADLAAAGMPVAVPDLRPAFAAGAPFHAHLVDAVAGQLSPTDGPIVLIGHSGAGPLLPALAQALGDAVAGLVFVDAGLPRPGRSWLQDAPADLAKDLRARVDDDGRLPPWQEWFGDEALAGLIPDPAQRQAFTAEVPRLPLAYFAEPAPDARWSGSVAYLLLSDAYRNEFRQAAAAGAVVDTYDSDHLAMLTRPAAVAGALRRLLAA